MMFPKVKTYRNEKHLNHVRGLDCLECEWPADELGMIEAHHIRTGGTSIKCGDDETVPLCGFYARGCHNKADKNPESYEKYKDDAARIFREAGWKK